jgi:hypothetical protein
MAEDVRDQAHLNHDDMLSLNFIRDSGTYFYRRHYRQGLRSHIMEVLGAEALENETRGIIIEGSRHYPRAEPVKMLRIFRTRFNTLREAEEELKRVRIITAYLAPDHLGQPGEFLVHYVMGGKGEILLCGLQEYVKGEILDPWSLLDSDHLAGTFCDMGFEDSENADMKRDRWLRSVREQARSFVGKLRQMIAEAHYVPDLAGIGNLLVTRTGNIKLVDINNISRVSFDSQITLDDRGYPVCDKSIEALSLLEKKLLGRADHEADPIYRVFLDPERMKEVRAAEKAFYLSMEAEGREPWSFRPESH